VSSMAALAAPRARIQHLLRRAGFGYRADELESYVALGLEGTVDRLLLPETIDDSASEAATATLLAPFQLDRFNKDNKDVDVDRMQRGALYPSWYARMQTSNRPLRERMTYFWHDHFATALSKVQIAAYMQTQNETLRAKGLGPFRELLLAVARDPAMLVYLDNRTNVRTAPNENYARELMELHTLGEGRGYTETDIHEVARALTGWRIGEDGTAQFRAAQHDIKNKTVLGLTGNFDDAAVIDILADDRMTAEYVVGKLVRYFVHPDGEPDLEARAIDVFRNTRGQMREVMKTILLSNEMYSDRAYRSIIKSPTELLVGAKRALEAPLTDGRIEVDYARLLGQLVYEPPNPAGWTGGSDWVNAATVLGRANFASELTALKGKNAADIPGLFRRYRATGSAAQVVDFTLDLLVGGDADGGTRRILMDHIGGDAHFSFEQAAKDGLLNGMVYLALSMPLYQVA